jgi:hypothetical protein
MPGPAVMRFFKVASKLMTVAGTLVTIVFAALQIEEIIKTPPPAISC